MSWTDRARRSGAGRRRLWAVSTVGALAAVLAAACGGAEASRAAAGVDGGDTDLHVVATTSIVGDIATEVAGGHAAVEVLLPPGTDPHDFAPSAADVARMSEADLVVANGFGLEEGLEGALRTAREQGVPVFELASAFQRILPAEGHASDDASAGAAAAHDVTAGDPHIWFDPAQMADAVLLLGEELVAAGAGVQVMQAAADYAEALRATDAEVADILAAVPPERRVLVSSHDNLGYLAARYDFEVVGAAIPSTSSNAESSAGQLAELAEVVRDTDVPAVFADSTADDALLRALAEEAGRPVEVVTLLTDALAPAGEEGDTYRSLLTTNARRIADALS